MSATLQELAQQGFGFAVYPEVRIFTTPGKKSKQHLLFGDYISPPKKLTGGNKKWTTSLTQEVEGETWIQVRSRQTEGWVRLAEIQLGRTLEINFVDIGQGDGCHMVTPTDQHFIIDAGESDNMYRFLRWRYNLGNSGGALPKFSAVISHPDEDHWKGFEPLLSKIPATQKRKIEISKLYHNGIVQRTGQTIGESIVINGQRYLVDFILEQDGVEEVLEATGKKSNLEEFLIKALENFPRLKILTTFKKPGEINHLYEDDKMHVEVLAPVPERINNQWMLRWFDPKETEIGKTKNGHSVVLMAVIGRMKIMMGGDLNSKSADYLMEHYSQQDIRQLRMDIERASEAEIPELKNQMDALIEKCRVHFKADIAKSCHHGSHDITNEFLAAVHPIATIISSGDEESFCHPRPETLGAIGKYGRGERPLIYSTELSRSSPEFIKIKANDKPSPATKQRVVVTYGMISVRTDGENAIIAQKLEKNRSSFGLLTKWQIDKIIWNEERQEFISKK